MLPAMREFFSDQQIGPGKRLNIQDPREETLFMEWITFDYKLSNGNKLIDDFISKNPLKMSKAELQIYEDLQMNKYGFFEINKVVMGQYLELESLRSGKKYKVMEKSGTHDIQPKMTLICRVGKVGDHWELLGSDPLLFPIHYTDRAKRFMRQDKSRYTPKDAREFLLEKDNKPSEFEKSLKLKDSDLLKKRGKIRSLLEKELIKSKSSSTVDDIIKLIYREKGADDMAKIISLFDNRLITK